jgi:hypothetical protein
MSAAFEAALGKRLVDRTDAATMAVAKLMIEFAKVGERDPEPLCALALQQLLKCCALEPGGGSPAFQIETWLGRPGECAVHS